MKKVFTSILLFMAISLMAQQEKFDFQEQTSPDGKFKYLCPAHLVERIANNDPLDEQRLSYIRYLYDALNQIGGAGTLNSLPTRD